MVERLVSYASLIRLALTTYLNITILTHKFNFFRGSLCSSQRLNDDEIERIVREAKHPTISVFAECLSSLCYDARTRELAIPIAKKYFNHLRKKPFVKTLLQQVRTNEKYPAFPLFRAMAVLLQEDLPNYFWLLSRGKDPTVSRRRGYDLQRKNMVYAKAIAGHLGLLINNDKTMIRRVGLSWVFFLGHHRFSAPKLQR
jgi:hypothetical protein